MVKKNKKINLRYFIIFALILICLFSSFSGIRGNNVLAEETEYSSVLEDLQKDETFNVEDYPVKEKDYSLQVIQIAESENQELFIYVYQPFYDEYATSINISTAINDSLKYINYELIYLNHNGTLYKYKVNDFIVKNDALRYYDISSIFRKWKSGIDEESDNDNTINEVSYSVGKLYTASTVNKNVSYTCLNTETIEITNKYVGFVKYLNGFWLYSDSCDAHYVAFSTDKPIDKLKEADLTFIASTGSYSPATGDFRIDKTETLLKTIYADDMAVSEGNGLFGHTYTWNRIESVSHFIENENLSTEVKNNLQNMQWVLRFYETDHVEYNGMYNPHWNITRVSEVTILRLKFETKGNVFNLGVVDNKQTGGTDPDNYTNIFAELKQWLKWILSILGIVAIIMLIIIGWPIVSVVLQIIVKIIVWILKGIWWVITAPFSLFKKGDK